MLELRKQAFDIAGNRQLQVQNQFYICEAKSKWTHAPQVA